MLRKLLISSSVAALLLVGCGSSDAVTTEGTDTLTSSATEIAVERGPVHGALVMDANGERAAFLGNGKYQFAKGAAYPITVDGGYIDVNRNNQIDATDTRLRYTLQTSQGSVVTLATTIASNAQIRAQIKAQYGLSDTDIDTGTPSANRVIAALSDELYAYCVDNNVTPLQLTQTQTDQIKDRIGERIATYQASTQTVAELESTLLDTLNVERLTSADLGAINQQITQSKLQDAIPAATLPTSVLTDAQKTGLSFMIEEEKVARDVYEYLYAKWSVKVFTNIAKSEQTHMNAIKTLIEKYTLALPTTLDTRGVYEDTELQALYNSLIAKGDISIVDALEVGVMVEETDIADLEEIIAAGLPEDLELVYENLLKGSYSHLGAFNSQLAIY